jgi:putative spermidine/putrescine transport system ATP-binding protein
VVPKQLDGPLKLLIRPEHIEMHPSGTTGPNRVPGVIERLVFSGRIVEYFVRVGSRVLRVQSLSRAILEAGADVTLELPPGRCVVVRGVV